MSSPSSQSTSESFTPPRRSSYSSINVKNDDTNPNTNLFQTAPTESRRQNLAQLQTPFFIRNESTSYFSDDCTSKMKDCCGCVFYFCAYFWLTFCCMSTISGVGAAVGALVGSQNGTGAAEGARKGFIITFCIISACGCPIYIHRRGN